MTATVKDPVSPNKHFRFGIPSDELLKDLKSFPAVKAIVLHRYGKKEHPHYHVWITVDPAVTCNTIKSRLIKHSPYIAAQCKTNGFWSARPHPSYDVWGKYVMGNPSAEVLLDNAEAPLPPVTALPIVAVGGAGATAEAAVATIKYTVQKPRRNESMRAKFVQYLKTELHWERESISLDNRVAKKRQMIEELVDFWENAFTTPQGAACIEHAMWYFADEALNKELKERAVGRLNEILRC